MVGLAWGIQSFARPKQLTTPNPAIAQSDMQDLRDAWLALAPDRRDRQYDLGLGNVGYHPSPKQPVWQVTLPRALVARHRVSSSS
jgi:hypothetical protein